MPNAEASPPAPSDFVRKIVADHVAANRYPKIITRFPPEPNGYLHIGHAKSICLNFGIAREFDGICHLRMDDTNPTKEDIEYVESIGQDVRWLIESWADDRLGLKPHGQLPDKIVANGSTDFHITAAMPGKGGSEPFYASDYFDAIYEFALELIRKGSAYVCDLTPEETDQYRGAPDRPGKESPYRNRTIEESLNLFQRMKAGEFANGKCTLRARIDMTAPNVWLRDPILFRIRHTEHHHTGSKWCIYPMYDFAHCLSDYIEGITHSICTLEFEVHRPLYNWILEQLGLPRPLPHQYEFARLSLSYTIMSKRKLLQLVKEGLVSGWDDPRLPTLSGLRRRGYPPEAVRHFCASIGVTKYNGVTDVAVLEHSVREDLNRRAVRRMGVLRPLKIVITNYPEGKTELLDAINNPEDPAAGTRQIPFSRELYIERDDFMEIAPPKFFRLKPDGEVRLKYGYIIKCEQVIKDAAGNISELRCVADLDSKTGGPTSNRKIKGTIHWVSAAHAVNCEVRLYDRLFSVPEPDGGDDFKQFLNPHSIEVLRDCQLEPSLATAQAGERFQFERLAYFFTDPVDSKEGKPVFNRIVTLRDSWTKNAP